MTTETTPKNTQEILATMDATGMSIVAPKAAERLEKKKLSASLVTGLEGCHARWMAEQFVTREIIEEEIDNPARRGNVFHSIMEEFFEFPQAERTKDNMRKTVDKVLTEDYPDMAAIREVVEWVRDAVNGYYTMGAKPEDVKIAEIPQRNRYTEEEFTSGLEVYVEGSIGDAKRPTLGFIDRVAENQRLADGSVIVEDWKTGAKVRKWKPHTKSTDGLAEQRQQIAYTILLEATGQKVSAARLIYPVAREIVNVDLKDTKFRERVVEDFEKADKTLDNLIETNRFEYTPSFLCAWCPLAKICPAATVKTFQKAQDAFEKQPEPEVLQRGIELR